MLTSVVFGTSISLVVYVCVIAFVVVDVVVVVVAYVAVVVFIVPSVVAQCTSEFKNHNIIPQ